MVEVLEFQNDLVVRSQYVEPDLPIYRDGLWWTCVDGEWYPAIYGGGGSGRLIGMVVGAIAGAALAYFTGGLSIYAGIGLGATIGGTVGGVVDALTVPGTQALLAQQQIQNLAIMTSNYGVGIPIVYGTFRVAGNVIQATAKKVHIIQSDGGGGGGGGGGKGFGGSGTTTSQQATATYSVSLAVGICEGPIKSIKRIWIDDTLVSDTTGQTASSDTTDPLGMHKLYLGTEDQEPDPFWESEVGTGQQPAYRGLAYMVLQDFDLGAVGRVPNFTFEVVVGDGDLSQVVTNLCQRVGLKTQQINVNGIRNCAVNSVNFVIPNLMSVKTILDQLAQGFNFVGVESEGQVKFIFKSRSVALIDIPEIALSGAMDEPNQQSLVVQRLQEVDLPTKVSLSYVNSVRNYHASTSIVQLANSALLENPIAVQMPFAFSQLHANALAETMLYEAWSYRESVQFTLPPWFLMLDPFDTVVLHARNLEYQVRLTELSWGDNWLCEAKGVTFDPGMFSGFTEHEVVNQPTNDILTQMVNPPTSEAGVLVVDAPPQTTLLDVVPRFFLVGYPKQLGKTFRSATLFHSLDNTNHAAMKSLILNGRVGYVGDPLSPGSPYVWDDLHTITVQLLDSSQILTTLPDTDILRGANRCMLGKECFAFGIATLMDVGVYELSHLLRGRQGTEWAITEHQFGEILVVLDDVATTHGRTNYRPDEIGVEVFYKVTDPLTNIVDAEAFTHTLDGVSIKPWAPVLEGHLCDVPQVGDKTFQWLHRARLRDTHWESGDVVIYDLDDSRTYRINIYEDDTYATLVRSTITEVFPSATGVREWVYTAADQFDDFDGIMPTTIFYGIASVAAITGYEAQGVAICPGVPGVGFDRVQVGELVSISLPFTSVIEGVFVGESVVMYFPYPSVSDNMAVEESVEVVEV